MSELPPEAVPMEIQAETQAEATTEYFLSFWKKKRFCDVEFVFENAPDKIEAHMFCLAAHSTVLDSMFQNHDPQTGKAEVVIAEATPKIVEKFLHFIYGDKLDVTIIEALHLLQLGNQYKVQTLVNKCEALIGEGISTEVAIEMYEAAESYARMDLRDQAGYIIARSLKDFLQDPVELGKLIQVKPTTLIALLQRTDLHVKEADLFQLVVRWGRERSNSDHELSEVLSAILPHIRFTSMAPLEFTNVVLPTKLISLQDTINIYAYITGDEAASFGPVGKSAEVVSQPEVQRAIATELKGFLQPFFGEYTQKFAVCCQRSAHGPLLNFKLSSRDAPPNFRKVVTFFEGEWPLEPVRRDAKGTDPFKECVSISTSVTGSGDAAKTFRIQSVSVKWPIRTDPAPTFSSNYQPHPLNFRIQVMSRPSRDDTVTLYTTKYDQVVYGCESNGVTHEISIEPSVEICNEFDYCITVTDEYPSRAGRHYAYFYGPLEIAYPTLQYQDIEANNMKLRIVHHHLHRCPMAYITSSSYHGVHVIRNICVTME